MSIQLSVALMLCLAGCAGEPLQPPTWEEFRAQVYQEPDTGIFIVNGDEPVLNEDELRQFYDQMIAAFESEQEGLGSTQQPLLQRYFNDGRIDQWGIPAARNLTYCISSASFGNKYASVVSAMNTAAAGWENTGANINFVHVSSLDSNCNTSTNVIFNVRKVDLPGTLLALAFFPDADRSSREVLIDPSALENVAPWTLAGIMRHELGHVLGFRHEHIRIAQSADCTEDTSSTRALTPYDSNSVMHYPHCQGTNTGDFNLTSSDAAGVKLIYPVALLEGQRLLAGQSISSSDGRFTLTLQSNGNLVHTWNGHGVLWSSGTGNTNGQSAWMQADGNFVLYSTTTPVAGSHLWATNTGGNWGAYLAIQDDGNLVVYNATGTTALWASNTGGR